MTIVAEDMQMAFELFVTSRRIFSSPIMQEHNAMAEKG